MNSFKVDKGTQALNYFAKAEGGKINKMKAMKLLWVADRYHLRKYGRSITDDRYQAMEYGPVPSSAKDIAQHSDFCTKEMIDYAKKYIQPLDKYDFKSVAEVDNEVFSETDLEALKFAHDNFGKFDEFTLAKISHAYPEWKMHKNNVKMSINEMNYLDFFDDPEPADPFLEPVSNKDPFKVTITAVGSARDLFKEGKDLEKLWY